ncbi:MAG TPA: hypothetical protein PK593_00150 [Thermomicrobiales bacterium]|nr:hypothetical protein [Thermomicrobiales bacterium]HQZ90510.1 hypothetical protein [Thermomicrobiales bacterium]HRA32568.1 hypothetical protein [Thermomicrobiales bacterium]
MAARLDSPSEMKTMTARYAGTCGRCGAEIAVGDTIAYDPDTRSAYCPDCGAAEYAEREAAFAALPDLTGDGGHWYYAVEARADKIEDLDRRLDEKRERLASAIERGAEESIDEFGASVAYLERGRAALLAQTEIRWWLKVRTQDSSRIVRSLIGTIREPK